MEERVQPGDGDSWPLLRDTWNELPAPTPVRPATILWEPEPPRDGLRPLLLAIPLAVTAFLATIAIAAAFFHGAPAAPQPPSPPALAGR